MTIHTRGPWALSEAEDSDGIECKELTALDGRLTGMAMIYSPNDENVMVASPDLYEVVNDFLNHFEGNIPLWLFEKGEAAIAKAKGLA